MRLLGVGCESQAIVTITLGLVDCYAEQFPHLKPVIAILEMQSDSVQFSGFAGCNAWLDPSSGARFFDSQFLSIAALIRCYVSMCVVDSGVMIDTQECIFKQLNMSDGERTSWVQKFC
jgi:hypothetical protein